jgi:hypothetical protein
MGAQEDRAVIASAETHMHRRAFLQTLAGGAAAAKANFWEPWEPAPPMRPNVVLILADDMGFSDVGCYGSEISTHRSLSLLSLTNCLAVTKTDHLSLSHELPKLGGVSGL